MQNDRALRVELIQETGRPVALHQRYEALAAGVNYAKSRQNGVDFNVGLTLGRRDFVGVAPLQADPRQDEFWQVGVKFRNRNMEFFGDNPTFGCDYVRNYSNLDLYVFDSFDCSFGVKF